MLNRDPVWAAYFAGVGIILGFFCGAVVPSCLHRRSDEHSPAMMRFAERASRDCSAACQAAGGVLRRISITESHDPVCHCDVNHE